MFQKKIYKKKNYLDFEVGLWNTSALRAGLVERISRSSRVSTFPKTEAQSNFFSFKTKKRTKGQPGAGIH